MKQILNVTVVAALVLFTFAAGTLQGQYVPQTLNIKATAIVANTPTVSGTVTKYTTTTIKITSQSLITLIGEALGPTPFPAGSKLMLAANQDVVVVNSSGATLFNATNYVGFVFGGDGIVTESGQDDSATGVRKDTFTFLTELVFDDGGENSFDCVGFTTEKFSESAVKNGTRTYSDANTMTGCGDGSLGGNDAILSGTITTSGKITL